MTTTEEIKQLIDAGRFEYSLAKSNQYFHKAVESADASIKASNRNYLLCLLGKEAYKELALNEARPNIRGDLWLKALEALKWCKPPEDYQYASNYAQLAPFFAG